MLSRPGDLGAGIRLAEDSLLECQRGVAIILERSEKLSGKRPVYTMLDDSELLLTIFAAGEDDA